MTTKPWIVGLLSIAPLLTGCIGGDDEPDDAMQHEDDAMMKDGDAMKEEENESPAPALAVVLAVVAALAVALRRPGR
jgi:hypothetical protein